jgi:CRISPR-associated endoribonuclease Cas6
MMIPANRALLAVVIELSLKTDRKWLGRAAQAWLLESVRRVDSTLADLLHREHAQRPYTISAPRRMPTSSSSDSGQWMRITSISVDLSAVLLESILPGLKAGEIIRLAGVNAELVGAMTENHPWAGQADFETLAHAAFDPEAAPPLGHSLEFVTPTVFHRAGMAIPLPIPTLVFGSLIRAWNIFSPVALPIQMHDFVEKYVGVARHKITTQFVQFGTSERHIGYVGTVRYIIMPLEKTALSADEYRQRVQVIDMLARFAFYAGVGARTAVGMGQVRPVSERVRPTL